MTPEPAITSGWAGSGVGASPASTGSGPATIPAFTSQRRIRCLFTTRAGGVSVPPYDSLNLGGAVGDDPAAVMANRTRLAEMAGLPTAAVVWMRQVHGTRVTTVGSPTMTSAADAGISAIADGSTASDGGVTTAAGVGLAVLVADCVPLLAGDAIRGVIAAVHAGRRGAADGIALRALDAMTAAGSHIDAVEVILGPAICGSCYEVPESMRDEVEVALPGSACTTDRGTPGLDLRAGLARQLREAGVGSVVIDPRCTYTDPDLFSHRRGAPTGRSAGLIWMPE